MNPNLQDSTYSSFGGWTAYYNILSIYNITAIGLRKVIGLDRPFIWPISMILLLLGVVILCFCTSVFEEKCYYIVEVGSQQEKF